jgi:hypothetical protein
MVVVLARPESPLPPLQPAPAITASMTSCTRSAATRRRSCGDRSGQAEAFGQFQYLTKPLRLPSSRSARSSSEMARTCSGEREPRVRRRAFPGAQAGRSAASITARSTSCAARLLRRRARARRPDQLPSPCLRTSSGPGRGSRPRSFNHLLGVVAGLLDWAVTHELLEASPLQVRPLPGDLDTRLVPFRRLPDAPAARCRGRAAGQLPRPATRPGLSRHLRPLLRARTTRRRGVRPAPSRYRHRPLPGRRARRQVRQEPPRPARARIAGPGATGICFTRLTTWSSSPRWAVRWDGGPADRPDSAGSR